ncbi:hypothetical protein QZH41_014105 [Actinostola sp. cb2023]|nr:hypothetical protein QZH41_014105 [Actinostola sp. cb2023]
MNDENIKWFGPKSIISLYSYLNASTVNEAEGATEMSDSNLHRLFSRQAKSFCGNIAIESESIKLTYETVDRKSNRFAKFLIEKFALQNEDVVAILLPRSPELYITMLAVLKAGGVYVCIDPQHQRSRLEFILKDTKAIALITTRCIQHDLHVVPEDTPILDIKCATVQQELKSYSTAPLLNRHVPSSNLCYIIYTSGSTGNPKGVEIEHRTVLNFIEGELEIYPVTSQDRVLQGFSPSFDASVEEIWLAFSTGATLVVASPEVMQSGPDLPYHLQRLRITVFSTVPALLRTVDASNTNLPLLKLLILGGEACGEDLSVWAEGRMLVNSYGPTETTVVATASIVKPNQKITIGKPLKNYKVCVLDNNFNEVPHGQQGELCIGGQCLARGYRNLKEKTTQQFITHGTHGKIYRTRDLARFTDSGDLEYLGRIDDQVKIRGFRVEVGSIETHLHVQGNVGIVSVVVLANPKGQQFMIAHIKLENKDDGFDSFTVVKNLKKSLPEYMIPNGYVLHDDLPKLASGKIDKKKLKSSTLEMQPFKSSQQSYIAPRNDIEKMICEVWEEKLGNQKVSIEDNFFDLGGQSVVGALVVSQLRKEGINVSVRDLYLNPTVAGLSEVVQTSRNSRSNQVTIHIPTTPLSGKPRYYLCALLQALWLLLTTASIAVFGLYLVILSYELLEYVYGIGGVQAVTWVVLVFLVVSLPLYVCYAILQAYIVKMIFLWRVKPGAYALWSTYYLRWWIVKTTKSWIPTTAISGTPLMNMYARIMGATIGTGVYYGTPLSCDFDLLEIGSSVTIEQQVAFETHRVDKGALILGRVTIADHCSIGARATIALNSIIKENTHVEPLTLVTDDSVIEENSHVYGSPATKFTGMSLCDFKPKEWSWSWWVPCVQVGFLSVYTVVLALPVVCAAAIILSVPYLFNAFLDWNMGVIAMMVPVATVLIQTLSYLLTALLKWTVVGKMEEGIFPINSWKFIELWIMERLILFTLSIFKELFATLYTNVWLKTLGMEVGPQVEFSTAFNYVPDLTESPCCSGFPLYCGNGESLLVLLLLVILSKWILIGRFRPCERPLWCSFVWRSELVASLEENVAFPFGVSSLLGTPFISWWFRALGAKIGSRVYLATIYLTEADLIEIGDKSCIAEGTTIQSHLFEDRVMKMDKLVVGKECTVCSNSIVLYGAKLEDRCTLMPLSLCMKSETLQGDAVYCGIPSQNVYTDSCEGLFTERPISKETASLLEDAYYNPQLDFP